MTSDRASWPKVAAAFLVLFALYHSSEWWQTIHDPASPIGPALMLLALLAAWPIGRWLGGSGYAAFGLENFPRWWLWLPVGMMLAAAAKAATLIWGPGTPVWTGSIPAAGAIAFMLISTFVPSVVEDILTRGFLLRQVPVRLGGMAFVLLSAALYTANHLWRFDWGITEQVRLFCMGLAYGAAAWRWRSLWGAVALHWGWNLANALSGPLVDIGSVAPEDVRLAGAAAHLGLLAGIVLLPRPKKAGDVEA